MDMYTYSSCQNHLVITMILILAFSSFQASLCRHSKEFRACSKTFNCGNLTDITYPFYGQDRPDYCGHPGFQLLECNQSQLPVLMIKSQKYFVIGINWTASTMSIARQDYYQRAGCPSSGSLVNITIDFSRFQYTPQSNENITLLYGNCGSVCSSATLKPMTFPCPVTATQNFQVCYLTKKMMEDHNISSATCGTHLFLPAQRSYYNDIDSAGQVMRVSFAAWHGFELSWIADNGLCRDCLASGGQCGHDWKANKFFCFCTDPSNCPFSGSVSDNSHTLTKSKIVILACFSALGTCMLILATALCLKRQCSSNSDTDSETGKRLDVEAFLKTYGSPGLKRYSYADLKKITNSFKDKLGEGGNGAVYKGTLRNGTLVAVKILKKLKTDAEEFINEVASIGRTNHINVVTLLGFCYEGQKRALLYEFMPNGSLEKFVYGRIDRQSLSWDRLFEIAVGIARGLEYLHRGCNTRILHFDIKPHNILLDESFCPKISDFGLAKLCPQKDSLVSMSEARGTVGYIAPEVFLRSFGGVSYKSDVYSYGMLVLEMVGCRRNAEAGQVENSIDQYFPDWIYKQLEREDDELNFHTMLDGEERELQRKMITVSLWCVQTNPSSRPAMSKVVEMLEGDIESLPIPPKSFSSTSRSQSQSRSSTTRNST